MNKFSYVIYEGDFDKSDIKIIKKGEFTANIKHEVNQVQRDIKPVQLQDVKE